MFYELTADTWGEEEYQAIDRVIKSKRFTMGKETEAFENEFAAKMGTRFAIMVNSGSSANLCALASLFYVKDNPLKPGDEVIVPAISWATTYHPLQQYGLKLRFVDIDLETLNMDTSKLVAAITPKTKMILGVSILGNPADLADIRHICDYYKLHFFEDNCESMGATLHGREAGAFGDVGTYSTFYSHHISTMEGGLVVTNDEEIYHLCLAIRAHGWTRNLPANSPLFRKHPDDFYEAYRFIVPGYNLRPLEFSAAIGREQLKKLDQMVDIRRKNAALFQSLFKDDYRFIIQRENGKSSWFSFTMIINPTLNRLERSQVLARLKEAGIEYRIITGGNFLRHDAIKYFDYDCAHPIVNANIAHDRGFFVGNAPIDLTAQIVKLHAVLSGSF